MGHYVFLQAGREFSSPLSTLHLHFLKGTLGVKQSTTNWAVLQECGHEPLQFYWFPSAVKLFNSMLNTNSVTLRRVVQADLNLHFTVSFRCLLGCLIAERFSGTAWVWGVRCTSCSNWACFFLCKSLLQTWSIGWEVFEETLSCWTPICTTTNWPLIILGLPSLFPEMSVCRLLWEASEDSREL